MKSHFILFCIFLAFTSACSHHVAPTVVERAPQSVESSDCKKITEYTDRYVLNYLKAFPKVQKHQLKVLGTYNHKLKFQIAKLISGINHESISNSTSLSLKDYKGYLNELVAKSAYVSALYHQLKSANVFEMCRPFSYSEIVLDEAAFKLAIERAQILGKEKGYIIEMKDEWVKNVLKGTVKILLKEGAHEIHDAVIQSIAMSGVEAITRQTAGGLARGVLVGATTGTLLTMLTKPLKSGTIPEYSKWQTAIGSTLELYLNPEWMKNAGVKTIDPWTTHYQAVSSNNERMKYLETKLYEKLDNSFFSRISYIYQNYKNAESDAIKQKFHLEHAESTGVRKNLVPEDRVPIWMK